MESRTPAKAYEKSGLEVDDLSPRKAGELLVPRGAGGRLLVGHIEQRRLWSRQKEV